MGIAPDDAFDGVVENWEDYSLVPNDYITKSDASYDNERELYQVLATECYNMWGTPITYYYASYNTSFDTLFGEDQDLFWEDKIDLSAMFELPNRSRVYTQFGIISVETYQIYITKDHFDAMSGGTGHSPYTGRQPRIGDVIRNHYREPYEAAFYEITDVNYTDEQFEQAQHFWTLTVKPYKDNRIKATSAISGDLLEKYTNQTFDIFNVSDMVEILEPTVEYDGSNETQPNGNF